MLSLHTPRRILAVLLPLVLAVAVTAADPAERSALPYRVLIVDGQNNHGVWPKTTSKMKEILEATGLFKVDVATTKPNSTEGFEPKFSDYAVVLSNYNGQPWPRRTEEAFVEYVKNGGGFVSVHAANNSFPKWDEYNEMIGVGGWGGRNEQSGPYIRIKDGKVVRDEKKGQGGSHGRQHEFVLETFDNEHPITRGLPTKWMHGQDELYDRLRGPAKNLTVLATAFSDPKTGGTGEHEPLLMALSYGKGRIFHTALGHDLPAVQCAGFQVTLQRGTEWAATGKVTQKVPDDFPSADKVSSRK